MSQKPEVALATFISHPFSGDQKGNESRVAEIARNLAMEGRLPLAPQIYLPQFLDEATERDIAMRVCLRMVALADEVRVFGSPSAGMLEEIAEAERLGIPVVRVVKP